MHPSPDQAKQRALAWALYLVTGQRANLSKVAHSKHITRRSARALHQACGALETAEWEVRQELANMVHRSLKGL